MDSDIAPATWRHSDHSEADQQAALRRVELIHAQRNSSRFRCGQSSSDCFDTHPNQCNPHDDPGSTPPNLRGCVSPAVGPSAPPPGALSSFCARTRKRRHRLDFSTHSVQRDTGRAATRSRMLLLTREQQANESAPDQTRNRPAAHCPIPQTCERSDRWLIEFEHPGLSLSDRRVFLHTRSQPAEPRHPAAPSVAALLDLVRESWQLPSH